MAADEILIGLDGGEAIGDGLLLLVGERRPLISSRRE